MDADIEDEWDRMCMAAGTLSAILEVQAREKAPQSPRQRPACASDGSRHPCTVEAHQKAVERLVGMCRDLASAATCYECPVFKAGRTCRHGCRQAILSMAYEDVGANRTGPRMPTADEDRRLREHIAAGDGDDHARR